jgi:N-formylglutamate deformylase
MSVPATSPASASAYRLTLPDAAGLPIVVDSPHSGIDYPADFDTTVPLQRLRHAEDTWVDALWAHAPRFGATLLAARFPRAYIDPNRGLEDIDAALLDAPWPGPVTPSRKTELGIGLVWRLMDRQPMYARRLSVAEVQRRIDTCWTPYHAALDGALARAAAAAPCRWHLNVHSMPDDSYALMGPPADKVLADFVLGNLDGATCDAATMDIIEGALRGHGFSVARNDPFKGVEIIRRSGRPEAGHHSVQIEIKRSLYMDGQLQPHAGFERVRAGVDAVLAALQAHARACTA